MIKIKQVEVRNYYEHVYCECGQELNYSNTALLSNPPKYLHKCYKCNNSRYLDYPYPRLVTEPVNG